MIFEDPMFQAYAVMLWALSFLGGVLLARFLSSRKKFRPAFSFDQSSPDIRYLDELYCSTFNTIVCIASIIFWALLNPVLLGHRLFEENPAFATDSIICGIVSYLAAAFGLMAWTYYSSPYRRWRRGSEMEPPRRQPPGGARASHQPGDQSPPPGREMAGAPQGRANTSGPFVLVLIVLVAATLLVALFAAIW